MAEENTTDQPTRRALEPITVPHPIDEVIPHCGTNDYWIATWIWQKHGEPAWVFENTRVSGCVGTWWAIHVLARSGQNNYRLLGAVRICRESYDALGHGVMPDSAVKGINLQDLIEERRGTA